MKGSEFKPEGTADEMVDGKLAAGIYVIAPDGTDLKIFFDKERGPPVKLVANALSFGREELQQTTFGDYKDFAGVKRATKIVTTLGGRNHLTEEIRDYEVLDRVAPDCFSEPE